MADCQLANVLKTLQENDRRQQAELLKTVMGGRQKMQLKRDATKNKAGNNMNQTNLMITGEMVT